MTPQFIATIIGILAKADAAALTFINQCINDGVTLPAPFDKFSLPEVQKALQVFQNLLPIIRELEPIIEALLAAQAAAAPTTAPPATE